MPANETILAMGGAFAGFAEAIAVQPFDMVKTRHQLNHNANESVLASLRQLYKEGGFSRFYRGMTAEIVGIVPKSSGMYATYEIVKRYMDKLEGFENSSLSAYCGGFASGIPESLIVTPTQVVKVRLQAKEHLGRYRGPVDCIRQILKTEGLTAFYTGIEPTLWRNCVWNTVYFGTMHWLKGQMPHPKSKVMDLAQTLISGFCGAVFATCFNAPFDVVKSRFQSELTIPGLPRVYKYTLPSLVKIYREEGLSAIYKGFAPKAIRMGLGGAVAMASFELTQYMFMISP